MTIRRFIPFSLIVLLLAGCNALESSNQFAVLDLNAIAKALGRDDVILQNVQSANLTLNQQLEKIARDLRAQVETEKTKLGNNPSKAEEQKFLQMVQNANNLLNQNKQEALQKSQQVQNKLVTEFRKEVSDIAKMIAKNNGYRAVLAINDGVLWSDATVDITDEVIAVMRNDEYEAFNESDGIKETTI